jgi:hypothetical protein
MRHHRAHCRGACKNNHNMHVVMIGGDWYNKLCRLVQLVVFGPTACFTPVRPLPYLHTAGWQVVGGNWQSTTQVAPFVCCVACRACSVP